MRPSSFARLCSLAFALVRTVAGALAFGAPLAFWRNRLCCAAGHWRRAAAEPRLAGTTDPEKRQIRDVTMHRDSNAPSLSVKRLRLRLRQADRSGAADQSWPRTAQTCDGTDMHTLSTHTAPQYLRSGSSLPPSLCEMLPPPAARSLHSSRPVPSTAGRHRTAPSGANVKPWRLPAAHRMRRKSRAQRRAPLKRRTDGTKEQRRSGRS